jgi:hypothetical protein
VSPAPRPAAGGGRWVEVGPERLDRWLAGFAERHGRGPFEVGGGQVVVTGADGARAEVEVPFPPLAGDDVEALLAHVRRPRRLGLLLVRLGGHGCGVAEGDRLVVSKVGSRQVHGRSAAGGWSQQRFARRREGQARVALQAAADTAARVLLPHAGSLDAVVTGGDRTAVDDVLADPRLAPLRALVTGRLLDVPDPRQTVLEQAVARARAVHVRVLDP